MAGSAISVLPGSETPSRLGKRRPAGSAALEQLREGLSGQVGNVLTAPSVRAFNRAVETIGFDELWTLLSGAPWAEPYITHLTELAGARLKADGGLQAENLLANVHGRESLRPLQEGMVVVLDLNGYSNFQNSVSQTLRRKLDSHMQDVFFVLAESFGASMLQMPAGDQYTFFLEGTEDLERDAERNHAFLSTIEEIKVSTGIAANEMHRYGLNPEDYPGGNFTFGTGVKAVGAGEVSVGVFTAPLGSDQGYTAVFGPGFVSALRLQKSAGKGQTAKAKKIPS